MANNNDLLTTLLQGLQNTKSDNKNDSSLLEEVLGNLDKDELKKIVSNLASRSEKKDDEEETSAVGNILGSLIETVGGEEVINELLDQLLDDKTTKKKTTTKKSTTTKKTTTPKKTTTKKSTTAKSGTTAKKTGTTTKKSTTSKSGTTAKKTGTTTKKSTTSKSGTTAKKTGTTT
ncbi:MAG: hypothetical protein HUJ58_05730, partial [Erysipelotrichaceae bacterium]|nr:hypothetical protein [Erysipelotrichaceae bacterium]